MILTLFIVILTLIFIFLSWACITSLIRMRRYPNLPPLCPGVVPIFGHLFSFIANRRNIWVHMKNICDYHLETGEAIHTVSILNFNFHLISDPDDCYYFANMCLKRHDIFDYAKQFLGDGLLTCDVPKWKRHRKMLTPALNQKIVDGFYEIFNDRYKKLAHSLSDKVNISEFDISEYVQRSTVDTFCSSTMGFGNDEKRLDVTNEYLTVFPISFNCLMKRIYSILLCIDLMYRWSPLKTKINDALSKLDTLTDIIIAQKEYQQTYDKRETKFKPYLDLLLDLLSKNLMTMQDVKDEATTIIFAGYDTSQITIIEMLLSLGTYSDVQNKVYEEIQEVFGGTERDVEKGDLAKLKYLDAVIKETLRLYPVVPFTIRQIEKDVTFKKHVLPAGDGIVLPFYALNRHPVWGKDAKAFNPERWLDRSTLPETGNAFASFGIGKRNCIGITYAMTSIKIAIVHVIRKFKITADITQLEFTYQITLKPISGHLISLDSRLSPGSNSFRNHHLPTR